MSELEIFSVLLTNFKDSNNGIRICKSCAKFTGRYDEWKSTYSISDAATSISCEICGKTEFTIRMRSM